MRLVCPVRRGWREGGGKSEPPAGTKLSADSVFYKYTADKAADGDRTDKLSRWVSSAESGEHWIMAEYDAPRKVNAVTLVFWTDTHVSLDFDIEGQG